MPDKFATDMTPAVSYASRRGPSAIPTPESPGPSQVVAAVPTGSGLSPTMQEVFDGMKNHGGEIHRYPGGYWHFHDATGRATPVSHGTSTVQALVRRGVAEYCDWKGNAAGRFPIKARLRDPNTDSAKSGR